MGTPAAPAAPPAPETPAQAPAAEPELKGLARATAEAQRIVAERAAPKPTAEEAPVLPAKDEPKPAAEGEAVADADKPAEIEGEGDGEGEPKAEGAEAPEEVADELVVLVPGRRPSDPEVEIVVDDPAVAELLTQLKNNGMRRDEFNRQMAVMRQKLAEHDSFAEAVQLDPVGVMLSMAGPDRVYMAMALLTDDEVLKALSEHDLFGETVSWDAARLAHARDKVAVVRANLREQVVSARAKRDAHLKFADQVVRAVERIVPETWTEEQADQFVEDALADVRAYQSRTGVAKFEMDELPLVLQRRLRAVGLDPLKVAQRLAEPADEGAPAPRKAPPAAKPAAAAPVAKPPVRTAAELKAAAQARARAAAVPSGAHGAPLASGPAIEPPPKGSGLAGAKAYLDKLRRRKST